MGINSMGCGGICLGNSKTLSLRVNIMCDCHTCLIDKEPEQFETWELYHLLDQALQNGRFGTAFGYADAMCVPAKAELGKALFPFPIRDHYEPMKAYSQEMIQGLDDRVEQYNMYATHRHIG